MTVIVLHVGVADKWLYYDKLICIIRLNIG